MWSRPLRLRGGCAKRRRGGQASNQISSCLTTRLTSFGTPPQEEQLSKLAFQKSLEVRTGAVLRAWRVMEVSSGVLPSWPGGRTERPQENAAQHPPSEAGGRSNSTEYSGTGPTTPPHDAKDASRNFLGRGLPLLARRGSLPTRCHFRNRESAPANFDRCATEEESGPTPTCSASDSCFGHFWCPH